MIIHPKKGRIRRGLWDLLCIAAVLFLTTAMFWVV